jgi:hypothetical protein
MEDCALSTSLAKECVVVRGDPMFPAFCEKRFADGVVINKTHLRFEIVAPRCEKANFWLGAKTGIRPYGHRMIKLEPVINCVPLRSSMSDD